MFSFDLDFIHAVAAFWDGRWFIGRSRVILVLPDYIKVSREE